MRTLQALGLTGHNMSVWAVTTVVDTPDHYLTGSADRTIKLWQHDQQLRTYKGPCVGHLHPGR
jgi:phospholipase A-2-activating protein